MSKRSAQTPALDLSRQRARLKRLHRRGGGGVEVARAQSDFFDGLIKGLFARAQEGPDAPQTRVALLAVGGYGRRLLAPYSDVDLLFLCDEPQGSGDLQPLIEATLYPLWDLRLDVGHAARAIEEQIYRAIHDPSVLTATLDARLLGGDSALAADLESGMRQAIESGRVDRTIPRRPEPGGSDYPISAVSVLEPNVKESPGGLRDYQLALWTADVAWGVRELAGLSGRGLISELDEAMLRASLDFLLRLRCELHLLAGRRADTLSIELQREVARNLGYGRVSERQAIEALLRDYYLHARRVYDLGRRVRERLEAEAAPASPAVRVEPGVIGSDSGLAPLGEAELRADPTLIVRCLGAVARSGRPLSEAGRGMLRDAAALIDDAFRSGRAPAAAFMDLLRAAHAGLALRQMHELGLLGEYLPEFKLLTCLPQYDIHHRFTVDEHSLLTVHFLEALGEGPPEGLERLAGIYRRLGRPELLKLALLLHDVGKAGGPGHVERSVQLAAPVLTRLGLSEEDAAVVLFLVRHHTLMSTLAQLRDIHDPTIQRRFSRNVGDAERLSMLYLLTYADMRAVGPGIWTSWKGALLEELYSKTLDILEPGGEERAQDLGERLAYEVAARVAGRPYAEMIEHYFAHMPESSLNWLNPARAVRHLKVLHGLDAGRPVSVGVFEEPASSTLELVVATRDLRGLLWRIAGVCTAVGVNILGAQVFTRSDGVALDTLQIERPDEDPETGRPLLSLRELQSRLADRLEELFGSGAGEQALVRDAAAPSLRRREMGRRVPLRVQGDNAEAAGHSVVQVQALDRLGLLYDITRTIFESGANVYLAKINTEAGRVRDAFYVDKEGRKLDDGELDQLCRSIEAALRPAQE